MIAIQQGPRLPLERAVAIVENAKLCPIHHTGFAASYSSQDDVIRVPSPSTFHSREDYYHSLYHEMIHASGHSLPPRPRGGSHGPQGPDSNGIPRGAGCRSWRQNVLWDRGRALSQLGPVGELGGLPGIVDQQARK